MRDARRSLTIALAAAAALAGCWSSSGSEVGSPDADSDSDADTDFETGIDADTDADTDSDSDTDSDTDAGTDTVDDCDSILAEAWYCLSLIDGRIGLISLETGATCHLFDDAPEGYSSVNSLARIGNDLYACDHEIFHHWSLVDGTHETLDFETLYGDYCESTAAWGEQLLVMPSGSTAPDALFSFDSYEAMSAGDYSTVYVSHHATRMTVHGDTAYFAWHSTNEVDVATLPDGAALPTIPLEDYDYWIWGMSVTDDDLLVVSGMGIELYVFDVSTGALLWTVAVDAADPSAPRGLVCTTGWL